MLRWHGVGERETERSRQDALVSTRCDGEIDRHDGVAGLGRGGAGDDLTAVVYLYGRPSQAESPDCDGDGLCRVALMDEPCVARLCLSPRRDGEQRERRVSEPGAEGAVAGLRVRGGAQCQCPGGVGGGGVGCVALDGDRRIERALEADAASELDTDGVRGEAGERGSGCRECRSLPLRE